MGGGLYGNSINRLMDRIFVINVVVLNTQGLILNGAKHLKLQLTSLETGGCAQHIYTPGPKSLRLMLYNLIIYIT